MPDTLNIDDRMVLAATVDRLIYGDPDTFRRDDARALLDLARLRKSSWLPFDLDVRWRSSGGKSEGVAAGVGNVEIEDGERNRSVSTSAGRTLRVGQWKLRSNVGPIGRLRGLEIIRIEKVMGDDEVAEIHYWRRRPLSMYAYEFDTVILGSIELVSVRMVPWKEPV